MRSNPDGTAAFLRRAAGGRFPAVAVVLGSGLGETAARLFDEEPRFIPYDRIPGFSAPSVKGHAGRLNLGSVSGRPVAVLEGRRHFYEGLAMEEVVFPVRALARAGVKTLVLTSAVGVLTPRVAVGGLAAVGDHINFMGANPLRGPHDAANGARFPDMTEVYSTPLRKAAGKLPSVTYLAVSGPSYETPAEIRMFKKWGADVVGMSLVPEAMAARQEGVEVLGLIYAANRAAGLSGKPLSHEEVLAAGRAASARLTTCLKSFLANRA